MRLSSVSDAKKKIATWLLVRLKQPEMLNAPETAEAETKGS